MTWCAETDHIEIAAGTLLAVFEQPWGNGIPIRSLPSGVPLKVRFPNGAVVTVEVIQATGGEAIIQTSNQTKWAIAQLAPKELAVPPPGTGGTPTTYWIVKEQIT
jgi:hypothetical protein